MVIRRTAVGEIRVWCLGRGSFCGRGAASPDRVRPAPAPAARPGGRRGRLCGLPDKLLEFVAGRRDDRLRLGNEDRVDGDADEDRAGVAEDGHSQRDVPGARHQSMAPATATPATYHGARGPGTFVVTALVLAAKKSVIVFSIGVGVRPIPATRPNVTAPTGECLIAAIRRDSSPSLASGSGRPTGRSRNTNYQGDRK